MPIHSFIIKAEYGPRILRPNGRVSIIWPCFNEGDFISRIILKIRLTSFWYLFGDSAVNIFWVVWFQSVFW